MTAIHIHRPRTVTFRIVVECPTCKTRRRMVSLLAMWYGATVTCCTCGDSWADGGQLPRPFQRGWRAESAALARARWAAAPSRSDADAEMRRMVEYESPTVVDVNLPGDAA